MTWWTKHKPATEKEERSNKDDVEMTENLNKQANEENQGTDVHEIYNLQIRLEVSSTCKKYLSNVILYRKRISLLILEAQKLTFLI